MSEKRKSPSLKDKLSRLTFLQACTWLGPGGEILIRAGAKHDIDVAEQVRLLEDQFTLTLDEAVATITVDPMRPRSVRLACSACSTTCEHLGAALSLILEEKLSLGLSVPPPERVPIENLSDKELVEQALDDRRERAETEAMTLRSAGKSLLWTDYSVTSAVSGKAYRVALRGWERGESYCSCPDFRKNTLGTCKHILHVLEKVRKRFPKSVRERSYTPTGIVVHLNYGEELELRMDAPGELEAAARNLVRPLKGRAITDLKDLLSRVRRLGALDHEVVVYPDAQEYIDDTLARERLRARAEEIRKDPAGHPLRKTLLKTELLPYQLDGVAFAAGAGRAILADDMGLGKTIQGIGTAELLVQEAGISRVLVVCPTSLKAQWRSEIERFSARDCRLVLGSAAERATQYENPSFFTICNYEQVLRDILSIEPARWDLIILDEGQRIKNWEAKTSRVIKGLRSRFALVLTGTPLENRLDDLFSIVEFIDDRRLGPAFRFFNRYRVVDERGKVLGYKNLDDVRSKLKPVLLRRTRGQVMRELPKRTTDIRRIPPTAEQLDLHDAHKKIVALIIRKRYISEMDLLRLQKALLMCRMSANSTFLVDKKAPGYSSKLTELEVLLDQLTAEEGRKVILFSEWTTMLGLVEPLLESRGVKYVRLDGSVPQQKRQGLVHQFQKDPDTTFFLTTNAGSTGLNLQAADTIINVDLPWNPAVLEQRISRAHRMGQKRPVHVYLLVTEGTLEESLLGTLSAKHELALAALDPESDVTAVDLSSGVEELKRRLEVLIGAKPDAPVDVSQKQQVKAELALAERKQKIAAAGGQLLGAAFGFLGELLPRGEETESMCRIAEGLRSRLSECLETGEDGQLKMTVTLPDASALDNLARSLAHLLTPR